MSRYLADRLLQSFIVLVVMSFVIFWLMGLMPGDPIDLMISADPKLTPDDAIRLRELHGLDRPISERYVNWLGSAINGDLGFSRLHAKPVLTVLWPALGNTVLLLGISFIVSVLLALPAGIYAAIKQYSAPDYLINLAAFAGISIPSFWLALLLITLFSVILGVLPASGTENIGGLTGFWDTAKFLVLPIATLTIASIGSHPLCPGCRDRNHAPGLYPDSACQGCQRGSGDPASRAPQRPDTSRHDHCLGLRLFVFRRAYC